ncbi:hypothetical protein RSAG8_13531, partial [Rhizoctonia solani AG-8 WAC10335]
MVQPSQDAQAQSKGEHVLSSDKARPSSRESSTMRYTARTEAPQPKPSASTPHRVIPKLGVAALDPEGNEGKAKDSEDSEEDKDGENKDNKEDKDDKEDEDNEDNEDNVVGVSHAVSKVKSKGLVHKHKKHVLGAHIRKLMLDICAFDQAQDAKQIVSQFDGWGKLTHIVDSVLVLHLNRPFKIEWEAWGTKLVKLAKDPKRMEATEQAVLLSATTKEIQEAIRTGVWSTMVRTWKNHKNGDGEAWLQGRRDLSQQLGYRIKKAKNHLKVLHSSGLDVRSFEPCTNFLVALDVAYNGNKTHQGNQKYTDPIYCKVNISVPRLKLGVDIPQWTIDQLWEIANPELELESSFLHRYAPHKQQTYLDALSAAIPLLDAAVPVEPTEPAIKEPEPSVELSSPLLNAAPLLSPVHVPTSKLNEQQDVNNLPSASLDYRCAPAVAQAVSPTPSAMYPSSYAHPLSGPPHAFPEITYPPGLPGQLIPVQTADWKWIWGWPSYQQSGSQLYAPTQLANMYRGGYHQDAGAPVMNMDFPLDPKLQGLLIQHIQPNDMLPPPEIVCPTPQVPEVGSVLLAKAKKRKSNGNEGSWKRKAKKSKEMLMGDNETEDMGEASATASPSQLPPNAGKPACIHLKVKGT